MQTKKRAKSVKFGKKKVEPKEVLESKKSVDESVVSKNDNAGEIKEPVINEPGAEEIKKKIAEKINAGENNESEPGEVNLASETPVVQEETAEVETTEMSKATEESKESSFGSFSKEYDEPEKKKNNLAFFLVVVLITFLIGIAAIGGYYFISNKTSIIPTPTPTVAPTVEPSPTESAASLSEFTIEVLNGSGISGVAAKVKTQLTEAGFNVDSIGNADTSDFTKTVIAAKKNVGEEFLKKLTEELEKTYSVETKVESLTDTEKTDVVVTIGSSTAN